MVSNESESNWVQFEHRDSPYIDHIVSLISLHFMNNYTKDRSKNLLQHIQGLTDKEVVNAVSYIKRIMPDDLKRDALIDDFYPARPR